MFFILDTSNKNEDNEINEYGKSDLYRYYKKTTVPTFIKAYLINKTFRTQVAIREIQSKNIFSRWLGWILYIFNINKRNISISPKTKIGYGLYIGHNGPIVVNPSAIIANNVNLSQFTTIGFNEGKAAVIGNNVYIGPNTCLVENVRLGNNVTISAGSVVTKDIPNNATAVGNYAKVINYNNPGRFILNRWRF